MEVWGAGSGDDQGDEDRDREGGSSREGELLRVVWWKEWGVMVIPEDLWTMLGLGGAVRAARRLTLGGLVLILGTLAPRPR